MAFRAAAVGILGPREATVQGSVSAGGCTWASHRDHEPAWASATSPSQYPRKSGLCRGSRLHKVPAAVPESIQDF